MKKCCLIILNEITLLSAAYPSALETLMHSNMVLMHKLKTEVNYYDKGKILRAYKQGY